MRLALDCKFDEYAFKGRGLCTDSDIFLRFLSSLGLSPCNEGILGKKSERECFLDASSEPAVMSFSNPENCPSKIIVFATKKYNEA